MPNYTAIQPTFIGGEWSPNMTGRIDLDQYRSGCQKMRNYTLLPQGGVIRRPGARLIEKLDDYSSDKAYKLFGFTRSTSTKYLLVFSEGSIRIYRSMALVHTIEDEDITEDSINLINCAQLADTMIITSTEFRPKKLLWGGGDTAWTLSDVDFDYIPQYAFNDAQSPPGTAEIQRVGLYETSVGSTFTLGLDGYETKDITIDANNSVTASKIQEALLLLSNTPSSGISVSVYSNDPIAFTITFDGDARGSWGSIIGNFIFRSAYPDQYVSSVTIQDGEGKLENAWSNLRGWPSICAFFEDRLILANSRSLPQNIWCSVIGSYFTFNEGDGESADAINRTIATAVNNEIVSIVSSREIQVLTVNSEHYNPYAMTPVDFGMPTQTTNGSKKVRAQLINGATYFVQRLGNGIRQFVYTDSESAYASSNIALLSDHLVDNVKETAQLQGVETDADYFLALNENGTIAIMNILRSQNISAWSLWETNAGEFYSIGNVDEELYCIISNDNGFYLCQFDNDSAMDLAQHFADTSSVTLAEQSAYIDTMQGVGDGMYLGEFDDANVELDLSGEYEEVEIGINFTPRLKPNPISDNINSGNNRNKKKRIYRVWVEMVASIGVDLVYNNKTYKIAYRNMPIDFSDPAPKPFTGTKEKRLLGYDDAVEIIQTLPFKRSIIRSLQYEVRTI